MNGIEVIVNHSVAGIYSQSLVACLVDRKQAILKVNCNVTVTENIFLTPVNSLVQILFNWITYIDTVIQR